VFLSGRPSRERLLAIVAASQDASPNYTRLGTTLTGDMPSGFRHDRYAEVIGPVTAWDRAVGGLRQWVAHAGSGAEVFPPDAPLVEGATLLVLLRAGPLHVVAPCRIVAVVDEVDRFGFAYGTLPGHPEQGEEAFVVESGTDGNVTFTVTAFSRPAETLAKLGTPVSRMIQRRVTRGYLSALRDYVGATAV
jgi:uncharacterized protein (UPF0548 family)